MQAYFTELRKPPSTTYLLGTDYIGRDVLSRIIFGSRVTLIVAFVSIGIGSGLGIIWGIVTGYLSGKFDLITQRFLDVLMSFPTVILALLLLAALGAGITDGYHSDSGSEYPEFDEDYPFGSSHSK